MRNGVAGHTGVATVATALAGASATLMTLKPAALVGTHDRNHASHPLLRESGSSKPNKGVCHVGLNTEAARNDPDR